MGGICRARLHGSGGWGVSAGARSLPSDKNALVERRAIPRCTGDGQKTYPQKVLVARLGQLGSDDMGWDAHSLSGRARARIGIRIRIRGDLADFAGGLDPAAA